jgi:hypothetical protein
MPLAVSRWAEKEEWVDLYFWWSSAMQLRRECEGWKRLFWKGQVESLALVFRVEFVVNGLAEVLVPPGSITNAYSGL